MSLWYSTTSLGLAIGLFSTIIPISSMSGGILSYCVLQMAGIGGLTGWQWLFIIEGVPTIIMGFITYFYLPDTPETCTFLTEEEKTWLCQSLVESKQPGHENTGFQQLLIDLKNVLSLYQIWLFCAFGICTVVVGSIVTFFLPAIIQEFGVDGLTSNLLSAPAFFYRACLLGSKHSPCSQNPIF